MQHQEEAELITYDKVVDFNKVKIRASSAYKLMIGGHKWTEAQEAKLQDLLEREAGKKLHATTGKPLKMSAGQKADLAELKKKKALPFRFGKTAITYIKELYIKEKYDYDTFMDSKETLKGKMCEQDGIALVSEVVKKPVFRMKNQVRIENHPHITGECDIDLGGKLDEIEDIKCSWDKGTFIKVDAWPEAYFAQGQCYMELYGRSKFSLHYCLVDTPEELVDREVLTAFYAYGGKGKLDPIYMEEYLAAEKKIRANHKVSHIDPELRVKSFLFERDQKYIDEIKYRVKYMRDLLPQLSLTTKDFVYEE